MKKIKFISWQTLIILFVFYILIFVFIAPNVNYPNIFPDKIYFSSADKIYNVLKSYTYTEKTNYINASLKFDILFPIVNALFLFVFASLILKKITKSIILSKIRYLPFLAMILDFTENSLFIFQLKNIEHFYKFSDQIAAFATTLKWLIFLLFSSIIIISVIWYFIKPKMKHK